MKKIVIIVLSIVFGLFVCAAVAPFVIDLNKHKGENHRDCETISSKRFGFYPV